MRGQSIARDIENSGNTTRCFKVCTRTVQLLKTYMRDSVRILCRGVLYIVFYLVYVCTSNIYHINTLELLCWPIACYHTVFRIAV